MKYKKFISYRDYIKHQIKKIVTYNQFRKKLIKGIPESKKLYRIEFKNIKDIIKPGEKILCLGARLGTEVLIWRELGYIESIGIDLTLKYVIEPNLIIPSDFHYLPFKNNIFDNVYTNSIDHCLDINKMFKEMIRVLKLEGTIILRVENQKTEGKFESCFWSNIKEIEQIAKNNGLIIIYNKLAIGWNKPTQNYSIVFKRGN